MSKPIYFEIYDEHKISSHEVDTVEEMDAVLAEVQKTHKWASIRNMVAEPVVGMGGTYSIGSDRYAFTIVEVKTPRKIVVQLDRAVRTDDNGYGGSQEYRYEPQPESEKITITKRVNGSWIEEGRPLRGYGLYQPGYRRAYQDPSF